MAQVTVEQIAACGVVGAGGAGFPTHVKLAAQAELIILNAAECEPLLHKDKEMLRAYPDTVLNGLEHARRLVGARASVVGIKGKYQDVIEGLRPKMHPKMTLKELHDSYPTGDEFILVYDVTQRIIPPGKLPLAVGCVVINVETAYNVTLGLPVTEKFLTVAGAVKDPVTIRVPVGISFREALALAGGATVPDPVALVGGAMMGRLAIDWDEPITKTTGGLIVLPREHRLIERYSLDWKAIARIGASACDQCSFCTEFCPRWLLGHPIEPHKAMRSLGFNEVGEANVAGTDFCCECNLCTMIACPEDLDPKTVCTQNKRRRATDGLRMEAEINPHRAELHLDNRRVPISRIIRKLGLSDFENKGPLLDRDYQAKRVTLPLKQHIGAPAQSTVEVGSRVERGALVARPEEGKLGAAIHASITGTVRSVTDAIVIEA